MSRLKQPHSNSSLSRRRFLAAAGLSAGAALAAACGGKGNQAAGVSSATSVGLVTTPADTSGQAKRGSVMKSSLPVMVVSLDPHFQSGTILGTIVPLATSRLTMLQSGKLKPATGEFVGDLAESWEFSPDRLQITFKLRQNAGFAPLAPVNGRLVDAQDIVYSWNRFSKIGAARSDYANAVNPNSPIVSVTAPDAHTVAMKLAFPDATIAAGLSAPQAGRFNILPREVEDKYDPRNTLIGSGPYYLAEDTQSVRYVFKRNPNYYNQTNPFLESIEYPIIPEYATAAAELKAGALYTYPVKQEDILPIKQDVSDLLMYQSQVVADGSGIRCGYRPTDNGPFRDLRLRQAYSVALDRELFLEVRYNVSKFKQQGLPIEARWNSPTQCDEYVGWWLDPQSKDFGPNAIYYQHNIAEAKKLVAAAGYPNGVEVISNSAPNGYDSTYPGIIQTLEGMGRDAGFTFSTKIHDYSTDFQPHYRDNHGDFEGVAYGPLLTLNTDAVGRIAGLYYSGSGATFLGLDPDGKGTFAGDPYVDGEIRKARLEPDEEKRRQIIVDLQRYLGKMQYVIRYPGGASGFNVYWPVVKNVNVFINEPRPLFNEWIDVTQKPLSKT